MPFNSYQDEALIVTSEAITSICKALNIPDHRHHRHTEAEAKKITAYVTAHPEFLTASSLKRNKLASRAHRVSMIARLDRERMETDDKTAQA